MQLHIHQEERSWTERVPCEDTMAYMHACSAVGRLHARVHSQAHRAGLGRQVSLCEDTETREQCSARSVQVFRADAQQDGVVQEEQPDGSLVYVLPQKQLAS